MLRRSLNVGITSERRSGRSGPAGCDGTISEPEGQGTRRLFRSQVGGRQRRVGVFFGRRRCDPRTRLRGGLRFVFRGGLRLVFRGGLRLVFRGGLRLVFRGGLRLVFRGGLRLVFGGGLRFVFRAVLVVGLAFFEDPGLARFARRPERRRRRGRPRPFRVRRGDGRDWNRRRRGRA